DHQVAAKGQRKVKVLPRVAYLEMARAAIEQAWPERREATVLELRNTVWAQPVVIGENKEVSIALWGNERDPQQIDYEIYSQDGEQQIVHCHGQAVWSPKVDVPALDVQQLKRQMGQARLEPNSVYEKFARLGLVYGPAFQAITTLRCRSDQVLAELRLPKE